MKLKQRKTLSSLGIISSRDVRKQRELFIKVTNLRLLVVHKTIQILDYYGYVSFLKTSFHYNVFIPI